MTKTVLLTGATGFLGSHMIPELVRHNCKVICLARAQKGKPPLERIRDLVEGICPGPDCGDILDRISVAEGDVGAPDLGIAAPAYQKLQQQVDHIFHCAAMTTFSPEQAALQWKANVEGTENMVRFALGSPAAGQFHYVSTAYVAGDRTDRVAEDELDRGQGFLNGYEKSKFFAETMLRRYARETGLKVTFYRPSIIVGDSRSGKTVLFNGMYLFMRFFDVAKRSQRVTETNGKIVVPVRCIGNPGCTKNFVHIDYVVNTIATLFKTPAAHGKTYHLTHDDPPTMELLRQCIERVLDITGIALVDEASFAQQPANELELVFQDQIKLYAAYLKSEPRFERKNITAVLPPEQIPACEPMDRDAVEKLFRYALESRWGRRKI
jgi:thioester reductase-like protein